MNYGDGVYAGQFMGAMYSEAYFESDMRRADQERLAMQFPPRSQYAEMVRDMLRWRRGEPRRLAKDVATRREQVPQGPEVLPTDSAPRRAAKMPSAST